MIAKNKNAWKHEVRESLEKHTGKDLEQCSGEDVWEFFYGDFAGGRESNDCDYEIVYKYDQGHKRKWWNRLCYPLAILVWLVCVPFLWVIWGETGFDRKGRVGSFLTKITGD